MSERRAPEPGDDVVALVGTSLQDDRYAISGILGSGSQGATLEAVDKKDGRLVAIKRFQVRGARSWKEVELAEREARVLSQLSHPLLPEALAHFEEDGALYLVMEKVEGQTLNEIGNASRADVLSFLQDLAEVLSYLHGRSPPVIHRDIKPGNVIRRHADASGRMRHVLVDFGSVRDTLKPAGGSTVVGTFGYMAPEQFQGRALPVTDVYAVGVTALRMLTGVEPEDLPHQGLAIDVEAALGERGTPLVRALQAMLEPNPDERATAIAPLLSPLLSPSESPPKRRANTEHKTDRKTERKLERKRRKRQRNQAKRDAKRSRQRSLPRPSEPWPLPMRLVTVIGLSVAQLAVAMALHVVVPTVLTLLSVVFGRGLRTAAKDVNRAGLQARLALRDAMRVVQGKQSQATSPSESDQRSRVRIAGDAKDDDALEDETFEGEQMAQAIQEAEQAVEEAIEEAERKLKRGDEP